MPDDVAEKLRYAILIIVAILTVCALRSSPHVRLPVLIMVAERAFLLLVAVATVCAAGGIGLRLIGSWIDEVGMKLLAATGLGMGLLSMITLALGLLGWLYQPLFAAMLIAGLLLGLSTVRRAAMLGLKRAWEYLLRIAASRSAFEITLWGIIVVVLLMNLVGAFAPPCAYDDLEYHLGVPAQFHREGRIRFLEYNAYANLPENVEMWYLFSMVLLKSPIAGAYVGKLINLLLGVLTAMGLYSIGNRFFRWGTGDLCAAFFYVSPLVVILNATAHVEIPLMLYCVGALYAFLSALERNDRRWAVLCGLMSGLACGCKLTAAALLLFPLCVILAAQGMYRKEHASRWMAAALTFALALVALSPWLVKNLVFTGNPTFPLFYRIFGGSHWSAFSDTIWKTMHAAGEFSPRAFLLAAYEFFLNSELTTLPMFLFIPLIFIRRPTRSEVCLFLYLAIAYLVWFLLTHRADRFLAPIIPALCLLSASGYRRIAGRMGKVIVGLLLVLCSVQASVTTLNIGSFDALVYAWPEEQFFDDNTDFSEGYRACEYVNRELPADAVILFVGEARTFYCRRRFIAPVVFHKHPLVEIMNRFDDPDEMAQAIHQLGVTHILIGWPEVRRLWDSYGAYRDFNVATFDVLTERSLEPIAGFGKPTTDGRFPTEIFRVAQR